jgi:hypothetical protein
MVRHVLVALAVVAFMLWPGTMAAVAQNVDLDDQNARQGETVTFTVSINTASNDVIAFGFEITFDPSALYFDTTDTNGDLIADAAIPGPLVEGWTFFRVSSPASGHIRVGGSTITNGIAAGASGVLLQLIFTVVGDGDPASTTLAIVMPSDDVTTWTLGQGEFTFLSYVPSLDFIPGAQTPPDGITVTAPAEDAAVPFAFAVGIPVHGVTGRGAVCAPFTVQAALIAGSTIPVCP